MWIKIYISVRFNSPGVVWMYLHTFSVANVQLYTVSVNYQLALYCSIVLLVFTKQMFYMSGWFCIIIDYMIFLT